MTHMYVIRFMSITHISATWLVPRTHISATWLVPRTHISATWLVPITHISATWLVPRTHLCVNRLLSRGVDFDSLVCKSTPFQNSCVCDMTCPHSSETWLTVGSEIFRTWCVVTTNSYCDSFVTTHSWQLIRRMRNISQLMCCYDEFICELRNLRRDDSFICDSCIVTHSWQLIRDNSFVYTSCVVKTHSYVTHALRWLICILLTKRWLIRMWQSVAKYFALHALWWPIHMWPLSTFICDSWLIHIWLMTH